MDQEHRPAALPKRRGVAAIADQPFLLLIAPALFWSGNAIIARAVAGTIPPIGLAFWRWTFAAMLALPLAWPHLRGDLPELRRAWPMVLLLSVLGISLFNALSYIAANSTTAVNLVTLSSALPVMIVLASFALFGTRVSARQAAGIAISLAGVLVLVAEGSLEVLLHFRVNRGDLWLMGALICQALYISILHKAPRVHPFSLLFATFALGAPALLLPYLAETALQKAVPFSLVSAGSIAYMAVFPSILAYLAFNRGIELLGANIAGLSVHLVPVFGTILAALLLGELPHGYHFAGIALIFAGIFLASRRRG